jgi:hypothetical protein
LGKILDERLGGTLPRTNRGRERAGLVDRMRDSKGWREEVMCFWREVRSEE